MHFIRILRHRVYIGKDGTKRWVILSDEKNRRVTYEIVESIHNRTGCRRTILDRQFKRWVERDAQNNPLWDPAATREEATKRFAQEEGE